MATTVGVSPRLNLDALSLVEEAFRSQISPQRLFPGAALAIYRGGELVLDLVGGYADTQTGSLVQADSLFPLFSGTKPFGAVALWQLIERSALSLGDRVTRYWPEFGSNGKDQVLVRHILSHRGGFPTTPTGLTVSAWGNREEVNLAIERMPLDHVPGSASAYHYLTQHWVIAELIRRIDGRSFDVYVAEEITAPLGIRDTFVGLPATRCAQLVKLHATDGSDEMSLASLREVGSVPFYQMVIPGASGVSTARDMARFYAVLAAGGSLGETRILRRETVDRMMHVEVDGELDLTFDAPVRRGLGFELGGLDDPRRHWPGATSTEQTFWHGGMGSSVCWADRDSGLAMAFLSNGVRRDAAGAIARRDLSDIVRTSCRS
jgi:CubicO group peptidase (beta-lactamase class C family)